MALVVMMPHWFQATAGNRHSKALAQVASAGGRLVLVTSDNPQVSVEARDRPGVDRPEVVLT